MGSCRPSLSPWVIFHARDQSTQLTAEPMKTAYVRADTGASLFCQSQRFRRISLGPGVPGELFRRTAPAPRRPGSFNVPALPRPPRLQHKSRRTRPPWHNHLYPRSVGRKGGIWPLQAGLAFPPFHPRRMRSGPASRQTMEMSPGARYPEASPSWERKFQCRNPTLFSWDSSHLGPPSHCLPGAAQPARRRPPPVRP